MTTQTINTDKRVSLSLGNQVKYLVKKKKAEGGVGLKSKNAVSKEQDPSLGHRINDFVFQYLSYFLCDCKTMGGQESWVLPEPP